MRRARRPTIVSSLMLVLSVGFGAGCSRGSDGPSHPLPADAIRVGAFNFAESEVIAELYAQGLEAEGLPVARLGPIGSREVVEPALELGLIDLVPEYAGTMLEFVNLGSGEASADGEQTLARLRARLEPRGLVALQPAPAQDRNALVVRQDFAAELELDTISDLVPHAADLTFGGPAECPERFFCLVGLREVYQLEFGSFTPVPAGAVVATSLMLEEIDVGLVFSTDATLTDPNLRLLVDDLGLQPAENVTPVVRRDALARWGPSLAAALDPISSELTTVELMTLNSRASEEDADVATLVREWLVERGLTG